MRVIAATDADLESKISEGSFRASLLNRLASYEIWIPALRDRREDIGRLLVSFLREELRKLDALHLIESRNGQEKPWLPAPLVATLVEFDWPGNVRQLKTVVEKLVIGNRGREQAELTQAVEHLFSAPVRPVKSTSTPAVVPVYVPVPVSAPAPTPAPEDETVAGPRDSVETSVPPHSDDNGAGRRRPADISEAELREAWQASEREGPRTAERLGISRASLYYLKERFPWLRMAKDLSVAEITECFFACNGDLALMADKLEVSERALTRRVKELELTLSSD
mgnify:CR=1 FL=1